MVEIGHVTYHLNPNFVQILKMIMKTIAWVIFAVKKGQKVKNGEIGHVTHGRLYCHTPLEDTKWSNVTFLTNFVFIGLLGMIFRKKIMDQNQLIDQLFGQKIDFSNSEKIKHKKFFHN